jgi:DNA processing protein
MPDERSKQAAFELGRDLADAGAVVVSGLARGIDGQAHRGALETGLTVAVLGHGIDSVSPPGHIGLARRLLARGGALVSEYGPGEPAFGYRFVERNRIISGLARTVVVVQAPARSGALATADFGLDQGRDVVVHLAGLDGERGAGTRNLARQGAPVITGAEDVLNMWKEGSIGRAGAQGVFEW